MGETRDQGNGAMELGKKMEGERQLRKDNGQGEATGGTKLKKYLFLAMYLC